MDQALSLYLLDTLPRLDPQAPDHALDVITLVESILEDPDIILRKQLDRVKDDAMARMKQEGIEYDQRIEELEKLEYPKPRREFIYETFNAFAEQHPWVGQENIHPKSIAREMFEQFRSFSDYVRDYELQRAEGVLLRHLARVHKVLAQTVPDAAKSDTLREFELYLATMIRQVDSSLLDEWQKMRDPAHLPAAQSPEMRPPGADEAARDITRDTRVLTAAIRSRIFVFLRALLVADYERALEIPASTTDSEGQLWTSERLRLAIESYKRGHSIYSLDPEARNLRHTRVLVSEDQRLWKVEQMLVDPEGFNDWMVVWEVDLAASREAGEPMLKLQQIGSAG